MEAFTKISGIVVPLDRVDVDTDQIIPAVYLKRIEKTGFGEFLFASWRFLEDGRPDPEFVLNKTEYDGGNILVTGRNFGSGSSREHAPWALLDYGFKVIIAPSFAEIFHKNCFDNGIVPIPLPDEQIKVIMQNASGGTGYKVEVDLETCKISDNDGLDIAFKVHEDPKVHEFRRYCLMNGLDDISLLLLQEDKILEYERRKGIL